MTDFNRVPYKYLELPDGTKTGTLLRYNATSDVWEPIDYLLGYLDDIVIDTIADKDILVYDISSQTWINKSVAESGITGDNLGNHIAEKDLDMDGFKIINMADGVDPQDGTTFGQFESHDHTISDVTNLQQEIDDINNRLTNQVLNEHDDVSISGIGNLDMLQYNFSLSNWINRTISDITTIVGDTAQTDLNMDSNTITFLANGVAGTDAANKGQLDTIETSLTLLIDNQILEDHSDVLLNAVQDESLLVWDSSQSKWINQTAAQLNITGDNLGDHTATQDLYMVNYLINNLGNGAISGDAINKGQLDTVISDIQDLLNDQVLDDHDDVVLSSPTNGQFLRYSTGIGWINETVSIGGDNLGNHIATQDLVMSSNKVTNMAPGTVSGDGVNKSQFDVVVDDLTNQTLNDHDDVTISSPQHLQLLRYDTDHWENQTVTISSGDDLGNHIATQDLVMSGNKVTDVDDGTLFDDAINKGQLDQSIIDISDIIGDQELNDHFDVNINSLNNLDVLRWDSSSQKWKNVSATILQDNLGNHIATIDLTMSPNGGTTKYKIINLADGVSANDAVNLFQLENHSHDWSDISKTGSLFSDLGDVSNSILKTNGFFVIWNGSQWSTQQPVIVSGVEPASNFLGQQWQVYNATGNLSTRYQNKLTTLASTTPSGGLNNTWYTCDGYLVDISYLPSGYFSGGLTSSLISTIDTLNYSTGSVNIRGNLNLARKMLGSFSSSTHMYTAGGGIDTSANGVTFAVSTVEKIQISSDTSNSISTSPLSVATGAHCFATAPSYNRGYSIGGASAANQHYNMNTDSNSISGTFPFRIAQATSMWNDNMAIFIGGKNADTNNRFTNLLVLNYATNSTSVYGTSLWHVWGTAVMNQQNAWFDHEIGGGIVGVVKTSFTTLGSISIPGASFNIQRAAMGASSDNINDLGYFGAGRSASDHDEIEKFDFSTETMTVVTSHLSGARANLVGMGI